jgi:fatty-acyl-CoA synthase
VTTERSRTLLTTLEDAAESEFAYFFHAESEIVELRYADLLERARERAGALAAWGVEPGDTVGVLGPNTPEWVIWAFAAWARGATLVPIPFGMRIADLGDYVARLGRLVDAAACRVVIADPRFLPAFPDGLAHAWDAPLPTVDPSAATTSRAGDVAVLQFTSGTTSAPKLAELTPAGILACVDAMVTATSVGQNDVSLSWLPFFHDNGLFAHLLGPVVGGFPSRILPTERFARNPALWFKIASDFGATVTSGPCSAWAVTLKWALKSSDPIDLSSLRAASFGAEAIDPAVVDRYEEHAAELGLRPGTVMGAYGLAEATLVVSMGPPGGTFRIDRVMSDRLSADGQAVPAPDRDLNARRIPSSGVPTSIYRVRIAGPEGPLDDRRVGEIEVAGAGLMRGYRGIPDEEQPFTQDGWLRTGDAGYLAEGELFVTGRIKDLIIVFGRNYSPEEFEFEAQQVTGVRPGRCVAFAAVEEGEGRAVIVFEPAPGTDPEHTASDVRRKISATIGVVADVVPVAKGTVVKTTSGKLRRAVLRDAYARGEVPRMGSEGVPETGPKGRSGD